MNIRSGIRHTLWFITVLWLLSNLTSCSYKHNQQIQSPVGGNYYRTGFPERNVSGDIENIFRSIKKITNYSSYRTYVFDENSRVTFDDLSSEGLLERSRAGIVTNNATAGTALIIYSDGSRIAMLTCAHAVKAPDTIIQWNEFSGLGNQRYIRSFSVKIKQQLYVRDMPERSRFRVLASDPDHDIAIIGTDFTETVNDIPACTIPCGNSGALRWGSFIYLAGFPTGQQMVSHGIVSTLPEKAGSFLTDAAFNEGFSGGIALAVSEQHQQLELVGMASSVAGTYSYVLKPEKENYEFIYNPAMPYSGNVYVRQEKSINYGVTTVISIKQVKQFYSNNRSLLLQEGYNLDPFFGINNE